MQPDYQKGGPINKQNQLQLKNSKINDKYIVLGPIKETSHSRIYKGLLSSYGKYEQLIVKHYDLSLIEKQTCFSNKQNKKRLTKKQQKVMQTCNNPHILKCHEVCQNTKNKVMILEYHSTERLAQTVLKQPLSPDQTIQALHHIIQGIYELWKNRIIQVSLTPEGIVTKQGRYIISQFGFRNMVDQNQRSFLNTEPYWSSYLAPQITRQQTFTMKASVYNIGMLCAFMVGAKVPKTRGTKDLQITVLIASLNPKIIPQEMIQFIRQTTVIKHTKRINWGQMIAHPLFSLKSKDQLYKICKIQPISNFDILHQNRNCQYDYQSMKKSLIHELEKPYEYSGSNLDIENQQQSEISLILRKLELSPQYSNNLPCPQTSQHFYLYFKARWIYSHIYNLLTNRESLNTKKRNMIEIQFLVISRCYSYLSTVMSYLASVLQDQKPFSPYQFQLQSRAKELYEVVKKQWDTSCTQIERKQNKIKHKVRDQVKKLAAKEEFEQHQKFFLGFEKMDFNAMEQVIYTKKYFDTYIEPKVQEILDIKFINKPKPKVIEQCTMCLLYFAYYEEINNVKFQTQNIGIPFTKIVDTVINKCMPSPSKINKR